MKAYAILDTQEEAENLQLELLAEAQKDPLFIGERWAYPLEDPGKKWYIKIRGEQIEFVESMGIKVKKKDLKTVSRLKEKK